MTYLLIAWLYASGSLLAFSIVVAEDGKATSKRGYIGRWAACLTWPTWVLVGIAVALTGRP